MIIGWELWWTVLRTTCKDPKHPDNSAFSPLYNREECSRYTRALGSYMRILFSLIYSITSIITISFITFCVLSRLLWLQQFTSPLQSSCCTAAKQSKLNIALKQKCDLTATTLLTVSAGLTCPVSIKETFFTASFFHLCQRGAEGRGGVIDRWRGGCGHWVKC